jgi:phage terminase small subunit
MSLNEKQKLFCREYIIDFNATRAYNKTYPDCTEESARRAAHLLLTNIDIQSFINKEIEDRKERLNISQDRIIYELIKIAFSDINDYVDVIDGKTYIKDIKELDTSILCEINSIQTEIENEKKGYQSIKTNTKIKLCDKLKALELLGKHLKLFTDKTELTGRDGEPIEQIINIKFGNPNE